MIYSNVKSWFKMEEDIHFIKKNNSLMHNLLNHYLKYLLGLFNNNIRRSNSNVFRLLLNNM